MSKDFNLGSSCHKHRYWVIWCAMLTQSSILSFQHTQHMDFHLITITLTRRPGITTHQMGLLVAMQLTQEPVVIGVMKMVPQVNLTCRQTLNLLRQWFSIRCVRENSIHFSPRCVSAIFSGFIFLNVWEGFKFEWLFFRGQCEVLVN